MRNAARHGWTLSRRRNPALTQTDTEGEAGLTRAEHEEEVSVTTEARKAGPDRGGRSGQDGRRGLNQGKEEDPKRGSSRLDSATNEDMKTGTGRGGWLGQGGRHGHFQVHEEGPKRGTSRLAGEVMDMGSKAGLIQKEMTVRTSDFDGEGGKDPGLAIEVGREVGSTMGTAEAGGRQVTVLDTRQAGIRAPCPSSLSPSPPPIPLSLLPPFPLPPLLSSSSARTSCCNGPLLPTGGEGPPASPSTSRSRWCHRTRPSRAGPYRPGRGEEELSPPTIYRD